jgi:hypothetical protein
MASGLERLTWQLDNARANLAAAEKQGRPDGPMWPTHREFIQRLRAEVARAQRRLIEWKRVGA